MERKWTKDLLAQILFTAHECAILERLVQREMRGGAESVLEPGRVYGNPGRGRTNDELRRVILLRNNEIERLQAIVEGGNYAVLGSVERASLEREESTWTSERHAAAREQLGAADMDKSFLLEMEFPAALDEIGRLQVIVAMLKQAATPPE